MIKHASWMTLLLLGCAEAPVSRVVPLSLHGQLPRMESLLVGDGVRLVASELEHVHEGVLYAWARSSTGLAALGPLEEVTTFAVVNPLELEELLVTHELGLAPTVPSGSIIFRGRPGESLTLGGYGGPSPATMPLAQVTAHVEDRHLALQSTALPFLGAGLHYALWVRRGSEEPVFLGKLGSSGDDEFEGAELLANFEEVVLSLELDGGEEDAPGAHLMSGPMIGASAPAAGAPAKAPVHEH